MTDGHRYCLHGLLRVRRPLHAASRSRTQSRSFNHCIRLSDTNMQQSRKWAVAMGGVACEFDGLGLSSALHILFLLCTLCHLMIPLTAALQR